MLDTTFALPGLHRHLAAIEDGYISPGQEARTGVDAERRAAIRRNHTGTHLLHWALREVLGKHVSSRVRSWPPTGSVSISPTTRP